MFEGVVPLVVIVVLLFASFYFFMIRPARQQQKKNDQMLEALQKGDKVVTIGGILGQIESVEEDSVILKVESGATIRVIKKGILGKSEKN